MKPLVSLLVVSHSAKLAAGVQELAAEMAPDVFIGAVGGLADGSLGVTLAAVSEELDEALAASQDRGVAILADIGSAMLTVESVIDFADEPDLLQFVDAPLVEGTVLGAVAAQQGEELSQVVARIREAACQWSELHGETQRGQGNQDDTPATGYSDGAQGIDSAKAGIPAGTPTGTTVASRDSSTRTTAATTSPNFASRQARVVDEAGLHARPAAQLARLIGTYDLHVNINGVDGASLIELMGLGVKQGDVVTVEANGKGAEAAVNEIVAAIETGFDPRTATRNQ